MSNWHAIYNSKTGALWSTATVVADPKDMHDGLVAIDLGIDESDPDPQKDNIWDSQALGFSPKPEVKPVLTAADFQKALTPDERKKIQNVLAVGTQDQKDELNAFQQYVKDTGVVDPNDPYVVATVQKLEADSVLDPGRADEVLTKADAIKVADVVPADEIPVDVGGVKTP